MSYSIDANILIYASDRSSRHHEAASEFLAGRADDPDLCCLAWPTLMSYMRIATHPRIFSHPLSPRDALANIEALTALPRVRVVSEDQRFLDVYREVCAGRPARGNQVPDAHLAALLLQHGVSTLYTADSDFRKFTFLDVRDPLGGASPD